VAEIPILPPPIDSGKLGYIRREKKFTRPSISKNKVSKKKAKKNNSMLETLDIENELNNVNM
jgi:hypothetical protein